ncbi:unnamed protein product [Owenia fusiformis]|uniref:Uncharacterized protein n=1 Tax=Owenia fusiformis TaxID=6347 RepID=A0A8S4N4F6_OWEFU|nr:unnamed protein product [Owenia fusiformis]
MEGPQKLIGLSIAARMWEQMKTKNFMIMVLFVIATSISIWLLGSPTPHLKTFVSKTQQKITDIRNNMKSLPSGPDFSVLDQTYLEQLGFYSGSKIYPNTTEPNMELPMIATAVSSSSDSVMLKLNKLLDSVHKYFPSAMVTVFDLHLDPWDLKTLEKHCNASTQCIVKTFEFDKYPSIVGTLGNMAYKPIAIQLILKEYGAVIWADLSEYFLNNNIKNIIKIAKTSGLAAWTIKGNYPTTTLTHQKMFSFFKTKAELYKFHNMIDSDHLIIYNTYRMHKKVMLPWAECAMTEDCISPMGAQNVGCDFNKKPKYKYSNCHRYATSALNVILGPVFDYQLVHYKVDDKIFGILKESLNSTVKSSSEAKNAGSS